MHTAACRNRVYLSRPRPSTLLPGCPIVLNILLEIPLPDSSLSHMRTSLTPIALAFSHRFELPFLLSPSPFPSPVIFWFPPYFYRLYLSSIDINSVPLPLNLPPYLVPQTLLCT